MKPPHGYLLAVNAVTEAVRDWLFAHPGSCPTFEFADPKTVVSGDLGDTLKLLPGLRHLVRFDAPGLALAGYVTARVPRGTLLMLVTAVETITKGKA